MPVAVDNLRLVEIAEELAHMGWHGVHPKRLGRIALDVLLFREAAQQTARNARTPEARERAERARAFVAQLEGQVVRLYAGHRARAKVADRRALLGRPVRPGR